MWHGYRSPPPPPPPETLDASGAAATGGGTARGPTARAPPPAGAATAVAAAAAAPSNEPPLAPRMRAAAVCRRSVLVGTCEIAPAAVRLDDDRGPAADATTAAAATGGAGAATVGAAAAAAGRTAVVVATAAPTGAPLLDAPLLRTAGAKPGPASLAAGDTRAGGMKVMASSSPVPMNGEDDAGCRGAAVDDGDEDAAREVVAAAVGDRTAAADAVAAAGANPAVAAALRAAAPGAAAGAAAALVTADGERYPLLAAALLLLLLPPARVPLAPGAPAAAGVVGVAAPPGLPVPSMLLSHDEAPPPPYAALAASRQPWSSGSRCSKHTVCRHLLQAYLFTVVSRLLQPLTGHRLGPARLAAAGSQSVATCRSNARFTSSPSTKWMLLRHSGQPTLRWSRPVALGHA